MPVSRLNLFERTYVLRISKTILYEKRDPFICFNVLYVWCFFRTNDPLNLFRQGGYTFADKVNFNSTFGRIDEGFNYGGSFQFNFNRHIGIEVHV